MSLDDAVFLVGRDGTSHHSKGSDISSRAVSGDKVLVQRGGETFTATYDGSDWGQLRDDDFLLAWDGAATHRVTGSKFKVLFLPPPVNLTIPTIRYTGETDSWGSLKYELLTRATWNRPSDYRRGWWEYTRDGEYWYNRSDPYGYYYFENTVLKVRYNDENRFEGTYYQSYSQEYPIGQPT